MKIHVVSVVKHFTAEGLKVQKVLERWSRAPKTADSAGGKTDRQKLDEEYQEIVRAVQGKDAIALGRWGGKQPAMERAYVFAPTDLKVAT